VERVPPSRSSADCGAGRLIARDGNIEHREMRHFRWMICRNAKRNGRAPIMTDDREAWMLEMLMHEQPNIIGHGFLVIAGRGPRRIAEAAQVGRDQRELVREQRHQTPPFVPGLRPSMQQDDRRAIPQRDEMDSHAFEVGVVMCEFRRRHRAAQFAALIRSRRDFVSMSTSNLNRRAALRPRIFVRASSGKSAISRSIASAE